MNKETKKKGTKKPYQKPEIVFEDFSLSTNIAAGCEKIVDAPNSGNCGINTGVATLFLDTMTGVCNSYPGGGQTSDGYCYHAPTEDSNLFNS